MGRVNELIESLQVDSLDQDGRGVARYQDKVIYVDGALPGERVSARLIRRRRRFDEARTEQVLEPSPERVAARCPHFGICGGCSLQHLAPDAQLVHKQSDLVDKLASIAGVVPVQVDPPLRGPGFRYRRKARLGAKHVPGKGGVLVGFRERGSSFIADIRSCAVLVPEVGERIMDLRGLLGSLDARGHIPQIEVAATRGATLLVLRHLQPLSAADRDRLCDFARSSGLAIALQSAGPESVRALYPAQLPELRYRLSSPGVELGFGPLDFVQVNEPVNDALVDAAVDALAPRPGERVLDLFCGLGNFSLAIAARGAAVLAAELSASMVARAGDNAQRNGLSARIRAQVADLNDPEQVQELLRDAPRRLLLDPPRSGAAEVVAALPGTQPSRVVYVSCSPATLARDAAVLVNDKGFRLSRLRVVDMFPHTNHVESLSVFDRL